MKYKIGDKVIIKKEKSGIGYSIEFIDFLERHDYKLTILRESLGSERYLIKEMQEDSYFKDSRCRGSYIEGLYVEELYVEDLINSRFEILDL